MGFETKDVHFFLKDVQVFICNGAAFWYSVEA